MKYIALLRGINVGGNKRVEMKRLKILFASLGYTNVATYINSGNIIFESNNDQTAVYKEVERGLKNEFKFAIPTLVKTELEMRQIANAIPNNWHNDSSYKTDVAYLFEVIDGKETLDELPIKKEYLDVIYVKGAIIWHVARKNYNKSQLNKLIAHKYYQLMTVRNINTARYLAEHSS